MRKVKTAGDVKPRDRLTSKQWDKWIRLAIRISAVTGLAADLLQASFRAFCTRSLLCLITHCTPFILTPTSTSPRLTTPATLATHTSPDCPSIERDATGSDKRSILPKPLAISQLPLVALTTSNWRKLTQSPRRKAPRLWRRCYRCQLVHVTFFLRTSPATVTCVTT